MGMIEVIIAIFLTTVGILAILSLQPSAWQASAKSDYLGRASGILYKTLEDSETRIINPCNDVTVGGAPTTAVVQVSGQDAGISGDMTYTVATTIAQGIKQDGITPDPSAFLVTVTVTWAANATGISESLTVTRQELNRFPAGCSNGILTES
jgi:Tfp pilus assembly protein PilV